jgi:hypothetical protein
VKYMVSFLGGIYPFRTTFGSWVRKSARCCGAKHMSTWKVLKSDEIWTLRCRNSARRWGAKHISKSKAFKTSGFGAFLEVEMPKSAKPPRGSKHVSKWKALKNWWSPIGFLSLKLPPPSCAVHVMAGMRK